MAGPFIVMSTSRIKPGKREEYAALCARMFPDVEENEPRLLAFNQYESEDRESSVVIQVHPDAESFEYHLKLFGDRVQAMLGCIDVEGVEIYGAPTPFIEQFVTHGRTNMPITVVPLHTLGFTRLTHWST